MKNNIESIVVSLETSQDRREFLDGSYRNAVTLNSAVIGLGTYHPGWRWSQHAGLQTNKKSQAHIGYVISGSFMVQDNNGVVFQVGPGQAFEVGPDHDAWVEGDENCVAIDFNKVNNRP